MSDDDGEVMLKFGFEAGERGWSFSREWCEYEDSEHDDDGTWVVLIWKSEVVCGQTFGTTVSVPTHSLDDPGTREAVLDLADQTWHANLNAHIASMN